MMSVIRGIAGGMLLLASSGAMAQDIPVQPSNPLGECFVAKTTGQDRMTVARWMVAAFGSAPQVADLANVPPARKVELDRQMAGLFTRLMVKDCSAEARVLVGQKDSQALQMAGAALGQIAVKELVSNPQAAAAMGDFTKYIDEKDFATLNK